MPKFTFTSPEGKSYDVEGPPGATKEQAFAILQERLGAAPSGPPTSADIPQDETDPRTGAPMVKPVPAPEAPPTGLAEKAEGALEAGASMATALPAGVAGGVAGAAKTLTGGHYGTQQGVAEGAQRAQDVSEALTYTPRSKTGQKLAGAAGDVLAQTGPLPELLNMPTVPRLGKDARVAAGRAAEVPGKVARAAAEAVKPEIQPDKAALARRAQELGITLRPDMLSDNKFIRMMGEAMEDVPLSGSKADQRQVALNKALGRLIGADPKADRLTPKVFDQAITKSGETIGAVSERTPVPMATFEPDLAGFLADRHDLEEVGKVVNGYVKELREAAKDGAIPGATFRKIRSKLSRQMTGTTNGDLKHALSDLDDVMLDAIDKNAQPGDFEKLKGARKEYAIAKTLEPLVATEDVGDIRAGALMQAVTNTKAKKSAMARDRGGELGELARIAQAFVKQTRSSYTPERLFAYGLLGGGYWQHPWIGGGVYGAANLYNRLGPKVAERMTRAPKPEPEPTP